MRENEWANPAPLPEMTRGLVILGGLNKMGKHIYAGTVFGVEKAARRARGKRAKAARKLNRGR